MARARPLANRVAAPSLGLVQLISTADLLTCCESIPSHPGGVARMWLVKPGEFGVGLPLHPGIPEAAISNSTHLMSSTHRHPTWTTTTTTPRALAGQHEWIVGSIDLDLLVPDEGTQSRAQRHGLSLAGGTRGALVFPRSRVTRTLVIGRASNCTCRMLGAVSREDHRQPGVC